MERGGRDSFFIFWLLVLIAVLGTLTVQALPDGANNASSVNSTRGSATDPESLWARAGNVTEADFTGPSVTNFWQGFYGNVSGVITLEDSGANVLYNWSTANPSGEIYAANGTSTISWVDVQCLNYTATGYRNDTGTGGDGAGTRGGYNLNGMNLSELHRAFGFSLTSISADNVSATFLESNTHAQFETGTLTFSTTECPTSYIYDSTGDGIAGSFEEAILWDPMNNATIWAALLENDLAGFDQRAHDFEMLVLEDGSSGNAVNTIYYFWVELQ
ncbi:hypothetical protein HY501_02045 [Candidatus Woesearchaeota archaeon]|nr:hypothetical protein [Candidatus Woesearchaeota archaeon]